MEGALPEALEKHGLSLNRGTLSGSDYRFHFDRHSCALCHHYREVLVGEAACRSCPVNPCHAVYVRFNYSDNPSEMIKYLEAISNANT